MTIFSANLRHSRRAAFKRCAGLLLASAAAGMFPGASAYAADYPDKQVKIVVNFPAGGPIDVIARLVAAKLQASLKQTFVVENVTGASGNIGAANVGRSNPDGHTVLFSIDTPFTMTPLLYPQNTFKPEELKTVALMGSTASAIAVHPSLGVNSMKELVAKGKRETISFASAGNGSPGHFAAEMLSDVSGIKINHIPYRGNAPAVMAVLSGEVQAGILATSGFLPYIKSNKVKGLAVAGSQRSLILPDLPTTLESGYTGLELEFLFLALVPAKTPDAITNVLQKHIAGAMMQADIQERLRGLDIVPANITGAQAADKVAKTRDRYAKIIKATGMKVE